MNGPRRLLEDGGSAMEMALLRSAKDDGPPPDALPRAMATVGIGSGVAGVGAMAGTSGLLRPVSGFARWVIELCAWVTIGVGIVGGALIAAFAVAEAPEIATSSGMGAVGAPLKQTVVASATDATNVTPPSAREGEVIPAAARAAAAPPRKQKTPSLIAAPRRTLAEEVALLDSARCSLDAGNTAAAQRVLDIHQRDFQRGSLGAEAALLRLKVMVAKGESARVARAADEFLKAHPQSPHTSDVQALLGSMTGSAAIATLGSSNGISGAAVDKGIKTEASAKP